jgi:hypothetical protein
MMMSALYCLSTTCKIYWKSDAIFWLGLCLQLLGWPMKILEELEEKRRPGAPKYEIERQVCQGDSQCSPKRLHPKMQERADVLFYRYNY